MAHNALIGGVQYPITGGNVLVNGVVRPVKKGRTLVDGTGCDISFMPTIGTPLNDLTWEEISAISDAGLASNYFSVGDTKSIVIDGTVGNTTFSSLEIDVFIIGIDHNSSIEGTNKIHFQIGKINGVDVCLCDSNGTFIMNTSSSNSGGWNSCYMRKTVLGSDSSPTSTTANTLLACLPSDLRAVMKSVTKYSDNTGGGSNTASYVTATMDYLWLLSEFEVFGTRDRANSAEKKYQTQYDYYKAGNSKVKYAHNATDKKAAWWLRSVIASGNGAFCLVGELGGIGNNIAYISDYGCAPAFAV